MPLVVTAYVWGSTTVLSAPSVAKLARRLYLLCPHWTAETSEKLAAKLARGLVVTEPQAEAVFLPGRWSLEDLEVTHTPDFVPSWARIGEEV